MARAKHNPLSFNICLKKLNGRKQKKLAGNTWLVDCGNYYIVKFWNTNILTFFKDGSVIVRNGGHTTATTKARINEYLGLGIYQKKGVWYYGNTKFVDGMIVMNSTP